jgi:hypothetical protein
MAVSSFWVGVVLVIAGPIALAWAVVLYRRPFLFRGETWRRRPWLARALSGPLTPVVPPGAPARWSLAWSRVAAAIIALWGFLSIGLGVFELLG